MHALATLLLALPVALAVVNSPPHDHAARTPSSPPKKLIVTRSHEERDLRYLATCSAVNQKLGGSTVKYLVQPEYLQETKHYSSAGQKVPACVVLPTTPEQVGEILRIVDQQKVPFAVQSGGHGVNPGFSSTNGVHISLSKFNQLNLSQDGLSVDVGPGRRWGEVYKALEPLGRTVVGGRVNSVGVGGFLAYGGGYSFHSNQYGLGVDNILEYTLVLPTGNVTVVSATSNSQLFNALKGTGNNFGVITSFKLKTAPLPPKIWGGLLYFTEDKFPLVNAWIANFSTANTDSKAATLPSYNAMLADVVTLLIVQVFYDGPTPPAGIFDTLLAIPALQRDPGFGQRKFTNFLDAIPADTFSGTRNLFHTVPVKSYSPGFVNHYSQLIGDWSRRGVLRSGIAIQGTPEPFTLSAFTFATGLEAFPHRPENACFPTCIGMIWASPLDDAFWRDAARNMAADLKAFAEAERQDLSDCPLYPNYALGDTPLDQIYINATRLAELQTYRQQVDPTNVMRLAGGFKL